MKSTFFNPVNILFLLFALWCGSCQAHKEVYQAILGGFCQGDNATLHAYQIILVDKDLFATLKILPKAFFLPEDRLSISVTALGYWLEKLNTTTTVYEGSVCTKESPCPAKCLEFAFKYTFGKVSAWFIGEGFIFTLRIRKNGREEMLCKNFRVVKKSLISYPPPPDMFACLPDEINKDFAINGRKLQITF